MNRMYRKRRLQARHDQPGRARQEGRRAEGAEGQARRRHELLLDSTDRDKFAELLDKDWPGPLPYTLVIAPGGKVHLPQDRRDRPAGGQAGDRRPPRADVRVEAIVSSVAGLCEAGLAEASYRRHYLRKPSQTPFQVNPPAKHLLPQIADFVEPLRDRSHRELRRVEALADFRPFERRGDGRAGMRPHRVRGGQCLPAAVLQEVEVDPPLPFRRTAYEARRTRQLLVHELATISANWRAWS